MEQQNIQVPHSFFKKSKKEYQDWRFALFREFIQNSIDADANSISFKVLGNYEDNCLDIEVVDNGIGMNADILQNKLLCLGGSHKKEGSTGGFGYAKTLLFFAHDRYTIKTQNNIVQGSGGSYQLSQNNDYVKGCEIHIRLNGYEAREEEFCHILKKLVFESTFKSDIYLNGLKLEKENKKFDFHVDTPIGKLSFSDVEGNFSNLWLKVNGIPMFEEVIWNERSSNFKGEINLSMRSIDVLTSNRDALKNQAKQEFKTILKSLQEERSSLKSPDFEEFILNEKVLVEESEVNETTFYSDPQQLTTKKSEEENPLTQTLQEKEVSRFNPFGKIQKENEKKKEVVEKTKSKILEELYPNNFFVSTGNASISYARIKDELNKKRNSKLAIDWVKAVKAILYSIIEGGLSYRLTFSNNTFYYDNKPIYFGFSFSNQALASKQSDNETIRFLINPIHYKDKFKSSGKHYSTNKKLIDLAIHEATHLFIDYHNEDFCSTENKIKWCFYDHQMIQDVNLDNLISY